MRCAVIRPGALRLNSHVPQVCVYFAVIVWLCCRRNQPHADHILVVNLWLACRCTRPQAGGNCVKESDVGGVWSACGSLVVGLWFACRTCELDPTTDRLQSCGWYRSQAAPAVKTDFSLWSAWVTIMLYHVNSWPSTSRPDVDIFPKQYRLFLENAFK